MNASAFAAKLKAQMETVKNAMVEPGFTDHLLYRETLARYHALKDALAQLKLSINEDDETGT